MTIKSGKLWALVGASRSGKTQRALKEMAGHKSVLIWDIEGQYSADVRAANPAQLWQSVMDYAAKPGRIAYTGKLSDFAFFCKCAWYFVRVNAKHGKRCAVVFEETADVTSPGKAPGDYGIILRRGLKYGADLFAITQRPAESDKTAIGNASMVVVCRLQLPRDRRYMAELTGIPLARVEQLRADQDLGRFDYYLVNSGKGSAQLGQLTFPAGRPVFKTKGPIFSL